MPKISGACPNWLLFSAAVFLCVGCGEQQRRPEARFVRKIDWMQNGSWVKADTHIHTKFSDGAHTVSEVTAKAAEFGCEAIAITDHADRNLQAATPEYAEAIEVARRQHPQLIILAGLEWNVPPFGGDEHATVLVPHHPGEFLWLADFKSQFDDLDREGQNPELAAAGLQWLALTASADGMTPVVIYNHAGRKSQSSLDAVPRIKQWRMTNGLVVGLSGAPGHQRATDLGAYRGPVKLIDRWDPAVAEVGGAWDRLLQEGLDVWAARAPSDFHGEANDYWPGQFSETWLYVPERTPAGVLLAFRAGSFFAAHGHVAREVQLAVETEGLPRGAFPGEVVSVPAGAEIKVRLDGLIPDRDWAGMPNRIDSVEIIIVTEQSVRSLERRLQPSNVLAVTETLQVPPGGMVIRARGRRVVADGPDLLFYTNPIRITDESHTDSVSPKTEHLFSSGKFVRRAVGFLILLLMAICLWTLKTSSKTATSSRATSSRATSTVLDTTLVSRSSNPPRRFHFAVLAMLFTFIAIYGSLVPLEYRPTSLDDAFARFRSIPYLQLNVEARADWVANILLFVPISFLWVAVATVDSRSKLYRAFWVTVILSICLGLSVALEFSQIWFPPRTVSQNDILAESLGSIAGAFLWLAVGQTLTGWTRQYFGATHSKTQIDWLLQAYLLGLLIYSLMPLDLTIHPVELYRKYHDGKIILIPSWEAEFSSLGLWNRVTDMLIFVPVGALATRVWLRQGQNVRSIWTSIAIGASIVTLVELGQLFVFSRFTETMDLLTGTLGVVLGVWLMQRREAGRVDAAGSAGDSARLRRSLKWGAIAAGYAMFLCGLFWWPFQIESNHELIRSNLDGFFRVPFAALYTGSEYNALTEIVRKIILFAVLGMMLAHLILIHRLPTQIRRSFCGIAILSCSLLGTAIELIQSCLPPHVADITDVILYTCGACIGMFVMLRLSKPQPLSGPGFTMPSRKR